MEIKVRAIGDVETKSVAQIEEELLVKHEESLSTDNVFQEQEQEQEVTQVEPQEESYEEELSEEKVLSYIGKRYNKEISSFDELMAERQSSEEIPSDVAAYMKYKKDTGRGFEDFIKLNKDFDNMDSDGLIKEYLQSTNSELDSDDIDALMEDYQYDEDIDEKKVLSYIEKRYNKEISSFDELMAERQSSEEMPSDVAAYMKYKKDTGRGFEDFIKLNKDFDNMDSDGLIKEYLQSTNSELDSDDIDALMEDYQYDEDIDEESFIKKTKIAKKKVIGEAKKYFNQQKEQYSVPIESIGVGVPDEEKEVYEAYKQYTKEAATIDESNRRKREWFDQKTSEVLSDDFKGFDFNINDKKLSFSPGNLSEIKKNHATPQNFINKFLDENGLMKDAEGYHRSLAMAMNPDKFAKFFYEQGQADATDDVTRKIKNINMSERKMSEASTKVDGMQVKSLSPESGNGLKIRSMKRI